MFIVFQILYRHFYNIIQLKLFVNFSFLLLLLFNVTFGLVCA